MASVLHGSARTTPRLRAELQASKESTRPQAARKLIEAYAVAIDQIAMGPTAWLTHPRPYPELAHYGFRWTKIHRYWFGYLAAADPIITNILDETANIRRPWSCDSSSRRIASALRLLTAEITASNARSA